MNVKAFYLGSNKHPQAQCTFIKEQTPIIKTDCSKINLKIKALNSKAGERNKLKTHYGAWFVMHVDGWAYAVCTKENYPERQAYSLINQIKQLVQKCDPAQNSQLKKLKKSIEEKCIKYNDLANVDKVHKAQVQANLLQQQLHKGIGKLMGGRQTLEDLDDRAMEMRNLSKQFEVKASKIQSATFWQKWKFILILVVSILGFLTLCTVMILLTNN